MAREGCVMMGTKERAFAPLCNRSVEDLVPADNFYRPLDAKLDLGFVRDLVRNTYKARFRTWGSDLTVGGNGGQERALVRRTERPNPPRAPGRSRWLVGMVARPGNGSRG